MVNMRGFVFSCLLFLSCNLFTHPQDDNHPADVMKLLWEIPYEFIGIGINATPLMLGDSLVIMSAGKEIFAVEQTTGKTRWKYKASDSTNIQTDEFKTDGIRVFATHVEDIRAINITDGSLAWLTPLPQERGGFFNSEIAYDNGKLYAGGYLKAYCFNASSGSIMWTKQLVPNGQIFDAVASLERVYFSAGYWNVDSEGHAVGGGIPIVFCVNPATGDTIWTARLNGNGGPKLLSTLDGNVIYGGTTFESPSSFDAFDASTGQTKWSYLTAQGWQYDEATIVGDKVIANAGPYSVCAFNKYTGALLWRKFIRENAESRKIHYYNGYVYHTQGWRLYVIDPNSGNIVHDMVGPSGQAIVTIAVGNGRVFVQGHPSLQCYEAYKP